MLGDLKAGYCTLCRSRCGTLNRVVDGHLISVEPNPAHPTGAALCAKGRAAPELIESPRRLQRPLARTRPRDAHDPGWVEIEWDDALDRIATKLAALRAAHGAETVAFAVTTPSGTPMVDSFEWVERFARIYGTPNLIYAVEVCGWHKDYAHALTFGRGIGAPDYGKADSIILWGHNPTRTWLAQATRIADARQRGAIVVVVDPKRGGSGETADLWLPIRPGADGALAMGAIRHLLMHRSFDADFVARWTNAPMLVDRATGRFLRAVELWPGSTAEAFVVLDAAGAPRPHDTRFASRSHGEVTLDADISLVDLQGRARRCDTVLKLLVEAAVPYDPAHVAALTRLKLSDLERFYALFESSPRLAYHAWTGVGQHTNATATERAIATLYALTGAVDRDGGNIWTVSPPTRTVNDYALLSSTQQAKALGLAELPLGPPRYGWITARDFRRAVLQHDPYRVRALMSFGTNFVVSQGGSTQNLEALRAIDFHVHVDMFMNPTAANADIVLPASMPWEREALKVGFEITQAAVELVQLRQRIVPSFAECRADYEIVFDLAGRLGHADAFFGGSIEAGWNHQLEPIGLTVAELRANPNGIRVPQPNGDRKFATVRDDGSVAAFPTPTRRVELYSELLLEHGQAPLPRHVEPVGVDGASRPQFPLLLSTAKTGWYVHSAYRHVASLRRKAPDPIVEIGPRTASARGIAGGDQVLVRTAHGEVRMVARVDETLPEDVVIAEFGWWEDCPPLGRAPLATYGTSSSNINDILSDRHRDPVSGSVPLRAVACELVRDDAGNRGVWSGRRPFRVAVVLREGSDIAAIELTPMDGNALPDFAPGQHIIVHRTDVPLSRAYSLTGRPGRRASYEIGVKRVPPVADGGAPGRMSSFVHGLSVGRVVDLDAPRGLFTPPTTGPRPVILVAAGVGITPFVSYFEALAASGIAPVGVHLFYICRNGAEHAFGVRLRGLAAKIGDCRVTTVFTRPGVDDVRGRDYDEAGRGALLNMSVPFVGRRPLAYICGPDAFVADTIAVLVSASLPRFDIFSESFSSAMEVPASLEPRKVCLARTGGSFVWTPASGSLLDAAAAAALCLPSGCRAGQCESCLVSIKAGSVAHLSSYDGPADSCLTCRAVPLSDLVLDA